MPRATGLTLTDTIRAVFPSQLSIENLIFVCVGTDRSTGDSLGPLVGTLLERMGYANVIGTLEDPCHAMNLIDRVKCIPAGKTLIAIDSSLGQVSSVGSFSANVGPISPGSGVGKKLTPVGDYRVTGCVNVGGFMEYFILQNTRLSLIMQMAETIAHSLAAVYPLSDVLLEVAAAEELLV